MKLALGILIGLILLAIGWFCVEQNVLLTRQYAVRLKTLPADAAPLRIFQISDLHHRQMGRDNCRIAAKARAAQPDCIVITGDLISRDMTEFSSQGRFLQQLRKIAPVYLSPGNHELDLAPQELEKLLQEVRAADCRMLWDATVQFPGKPDIYLAGAALCSAHYRNPAGGHRHLQPYPPEALQEALGKRQGCTILLAHDPLVLDTYAAWGADLVLSGHVHGGLVRLPGLGGVLSPERKFFPKYDKGLYESSNKDADSVTQMVVSGGVAKPRFCNPPEVNLVVVSGWGENFPNT